MTAHQQKAAKLLDECARLQAGPSRVATAQEAVRQADLSQQLELQLRARDVLIDAATFAGRAELSLVAFVWNISHCDPERLGSDSVWFHFQWLAEDTPLMLAIELGDVEHILSEMARVYELNGWYRYPVEFAGLRSAEVFGATRTELRPRFERLLREVERTSRTSMYLNHVLGAAYLSMGQLQRGVDIISKNFEADLAPEVEYPSRCHGTVTLPLYALGRHDDAAHHARLACRMIATNPVYIRETAGLVAYASLVGDTPMLAGLLERHLRWAATNFDRWSSMRLYVVAAWALQRLDQPDVTLRLAEAVPGFSADGRYETAKLADTLRGEGLRLAHEFDTRHGRADWVPRAHRLFADAAPLEFLLPPADYVSE